MVLVVIITSCTQRERGMPIIGVSVSNGGRTLGLGVETCNPFKIAPTVKETPSRVEVRMRVVGGSSGYCESGGATIHLREPIGERKLYDAVAGRVVNVPTPFTYRP